MAQDQAHQHRLVRQLGQTDVSRLHADAEMIAQQGKNRYTAGLAINYATDHGMRPNRTASRTASMTAS